MFFRNEYDYAQQNMNYKYSDVGNVQLMISSVTKLNKVHVLGLEMGNPIMFVLYFLPCS